MLNLKAYSGRDLQNVKSLFTQLLRYKNSITVQDALVVIETEINKKGKIFVVDKKYNEKIKKIKCPSCEKGYLWPTPNYENLNILSCKKCRYSTILEEEIENG